MISDLAIEVGVENNLSFIQDPIADQVQQVVVIGDHPRRDSAFRARGAQAALDHAVLGLERAEDALVVGRPRVVAGHLGVDFADTSLLVVGHGLLIVFAVILLVLHHGAEHNECVDLQ